MSNVWDNAAPTNPWDVKSQDEVLVEWQRLQTVLVNAKADEMDFRKYVVSRAFPKPEEGTNTIELGNDYKLKATIKFNYKLNASDDKIEETLDKISKIGNRGPIVAERLVSWTPNFLLTEYRLLEQDKAESVECAEILKHVQEILEITDAAPTLAIVEPKAKK